MIESWSVGKVSNRCRMLVDIEGVVRRAVQASVLLIYLMRNKQDFQGHHG